MSEVKQRTAVFIAISPSHTTNFQSMIQEGLEADRYILLNPGDFQYRKEPWTHVLNGGMRLRYKPSSLREKVKYQWEKLNGYKKYYEQAMELIGDTTSIDLYFCHLEDVISNHMIQVLRPQADNRFFVVEDGLLNYYYPKTKYKPLWIKKLLGMLIGFKFEVFQGHATQIHKEWVECQYVRMPQNAIYPEKSRPLAFDAIDYQPEQATTLIIGQDIREEIDGKEVYVPKLTRLFQLIQQESKPAKVYYKPHRNGDVASAKRLLEEIFDSYEIYDDPTPVEECLNELLPDSIYSFESTAILNIKLALNREDVELCILTYMEDFPEIKEIYKNLGITIFE